MAKCSKPSERTMAFMRTHWTKGKLSTRAISIIIRAGIENIEQLRARIGEIIALRNCGIKTFGEIEAFLASECESQAVAESQRTRCDGCTFWEFIEKEGNHKDDDAGECRRFPPQMNTAYLIANDNIGDAEPAIEESRHTWSWTFPQTVGSEWCGEFKPKSS